MARLSWLVLAAVTGCGEVNVNPQSDAFVPKDGADEPVDSALPTADARPVQEGAALWLQFDDTPTDGVADSAGTHVTSCTSCPTEVVGRIGRAYAFTNDRLTVAAASDLQPGTGFTLALWVRVDSPPPAALGNAMIACKNLGDLDCSFALSVSPSLVPQFYSSSDNANMDGAATLALGAFHHIALTWNGTTKTLFFDGASSGSASATSIGNVATSGMTIGERQSANMPLSFTGAVDDLVFFNRVLSADEIAALANP